MPKPMTPCVDCAKPTHGKRCRSCDSTHRRRTKPRCNTPGCEHRSSSWETGVCKACKQWSDRNGGVGPAGRFAAREVRTCEVVEDGKRCGRPHRRKGMCSKHEQRARAHGSPLATLNRPKGKLQADLRAAAYADSYDCIYLDGYSSRPVVPYEGKSLKASRAVWIIRYGDPGPSLLVRHICNGGSGEFGCINIRHLCLGTAAENSMDMVVNGRSLRGEAQPAARLERHQVRTIRLLYATRGVTQKELADRFGVSPNAVSLLIRRKTWAWLD